MDTKATISTLSPRQIEILQLRANGMLNKQIAVSLGISENTVKEHVSCSLKKLKFSSVEQTVACLLRLQVIA